MAVKKSSTSSKKVKNKTLVQDGTAKKNRKKNIFLIIILILAIIFFLVSITRLILVSKTVKEVEESKSVIYRATEQIEDDTLELGESKIEQEGSDGVKIDRYEVEKKLLSGEEISRIWLGAETTKEPVNKIERVGTKRWQYMYCSDGSGRYYTDEQFQNNKKIGFTHSSPDYCAENGQGTVVGLGNTPITSYGYNDYDYGTYSPYTYNIPTHTNTSSSSTSYPTEEFHNSATYQSNSENTTPDESQISKNRTRANNYCTSKAYSAKESFLRVLGARGAGGSSAAIYGAQEVFNSTYRNCMYEQGF